MKRFFMLAALLAAAPPAAAAEPLPQLGEYLPYYPGLYLQSRLSFDARDKVFDQNGKKQSTAVPSLNDGSSLPEQRVDARFAWTFPMFEALGLPFFASRLHTARVNLGYANTRSKGALKTFSDDTSDDARTDADQLRSKGSGVADLSLEFGSWLHGSADWRTRQDTRFAVLALLGTTLPLGRYERDAATSAGNNTASFHIQLGSHLRPWQGGFLDVGLGERFFLKNQDAAFGGLHPANQGNEFFWDARLTQRVRPGLYLGLFTTGRISERNSYERPRFAPNRPPAPSTTPESDNYPTPGIYDDGGTSLFTAGLSAGYFLTQRLQLGLHYAKPLSGRSGEFDLPYTNRQPAGCVPGATGCTTSAGPTVHVDGLGSARSYASDRLMLTLHYNFGLGDSFTCTGCKRP